MEDKLHFESGGVELCGVLADPGGSDIVVVLCHGFANWKDSGSNLKLTEILNEKGVATFRFDFFGHGESGGDFAEVTPSIGVQNALDAIVFMKKKYKNVGFVGGSFGGYVGYHVAAQLSELFAVGLKCPVADFGAPGLLSFIDDDPEEWKQQGYTHFGKENRRLNWSFAEDASKSIVCDALPNVQVPVFIVHGEADPIVPVEQSKKAAVLIRDCELKIIPGANHNFSREQDFESMIAAVADFIMKHAR